MIELAGLDGFWGGLWQQLRVDLAGFDQRWIVSLMAATADDVDGWIVIVKAVVAGGGG